ncbi:coiled-coil domain-containing protein 122, partial [Python bivittatus]|uniref:Coiled-coil domain-containing protein 122 n=1 Tax=Python bivittatus TaxID=176946 RepID=A0A9F5IV02_PYTBI
MLKVMADSDSSGITDMVKQIAEQQNIRASAIEKSNKVLRQLQAQLQELEIQRNSVLSNRKEIERQIYFWEKDIATSKSHYEDLEAQIAALHAENVKLTHDNEALQEEFKMMVLRNRAYYEKMAAHRNRFEEAETTLPFIVELTKKRATVQQMMIQKEDLLASLEKADDTVGQLQDEISCLQSEIKVLEEAVSKKENAIQDEKSRHAKLQKEIE